MKRLTRAFFLVALATAIPSCGVSEKKDDKKKKEEPKTKLVGRVASLATDKKFVLIQSYGSWEVPVGSVLTTRGAQDRMANLRSTGENLGQFAAADIQSGNPQVGDAVYSIVAESHKPDPATESEKTATEPPSTTAPGTLSNAAKTTQGE